MSERCADQMRFPRHGAPQDQHLLPEVKTMQNVRAATLLVLLSISPPLAFTERNAITLSLNDTANAHAERIVGMALLGGGVLAIWNGIAPGFEGEFVEWHVKEHIPERVGVKGFLRGRRYISVDGTPAYFNFYETETYQVLSSEPYLARLNDPTPWTRKVVSNFRDTSRTICNVVHSTGRGVGAWMETIQLETSIDAAEFSRRMAAQLLPQIATKRGVTGVHLLRGVPEANKTDTAEKAMRSVRDKEADWILLIEAVTAPSARDLRSEVTGDASFAQHGAAGNPVRGLYQLDFALSRAELDGQTVAAS
jgi:hypothetical protein